MTFLLVSYHLKTPTTKKIKIKNKKLLGENDTFKAENKRRIFESGERNENSPKGNVFGGEIVFYTT